jgi:hypothetical protein
MLGPRHMTHPQARLRSAGAIVASAAALGGLAALPAGAFAADTVKVGVGESSIVVDGTTISTSNLTLAQLAKLQGVPAATVQAELDGIAASTPAASAVEALISGLPLESSLATALDDISTATGGAISPQTALRDVIADEGQPSSGFDSNGNATGGGSGGSGSPGAGGANGANGANGSSSGTGAAKKRFTLSASSRSLKGRPGKRVRVRFNVSSTAKLSYSGRKLAKGSRKVKPGANVLTFTLPRKHGNYSLVLQAVSTPDGQRAQTTIVLHDATAKPVKKAHR